MRPLAARAVIPSLASLALRLRRAPLSPSSLAALLQGGDSYLVFRRAVTELFPQEEAEILSARTERGSRENARVSEFLRRFEAHYFPVYEVEEYEQFALGIPFVRNGWSIDRLHDLDTRTGELLLLALALQPFEPGTDTRLSILDAAEVHVGRDLLLEIPEQGLAPSGLHERLDGTPYVGAAEFADWIWGATDTAFLDLDDEVEIVDAEWTSQNVLELAGQWRRAEAILDRISALASWLEADPTGHFARLLRAALGHDSSLDYQRMRRLHACEITEAGLVPVSHDEGSDLALPMGGPAGGGSGGGPLEAAPGLSPG
jgi:hypothetical protein